MQKEQSSQTNSKSEEKPSKPAPQQLVLKPLPDAEFKALQNELKPFNLGSTKGLNDWLVSRGAIKIDKFGDVIVAIGPTRCLYQELMTMLERAQLNKKIEGAGAFGTKHVKYSKAKDGVDSKPVVAAEQGKDNKANDIKGQENQGTAIAETAKDPEIHSNEIQNKS